MKEREDGWEIVLHSLMLGPSRGAKARGDHTMGGGVSTRDTRAYCVYFNIPLLANTVQKVSRSKVCKKTAHTAKYGL